MPATLAQTRYSSSSSPSCGALGVVTHFFSAILSTALVFLLPNPIASPVESALLITAASASLFVFLSL